MSDQQPTPPSSGLADEAVIVLDWLFERAVATTNAERYVADYCMRTRLEMARMKPTSLIQLSTA